jgi:hypothetical protein
MASAAEQVDLRALSLDDLDALFLNGMISRSEYEAAIRDKLSGSKVTVDVTGGAAPSFWTVAGILAILYALSS